MARRRGYRRRNGKRRYRKKRVSYPVKNYVKRQINRHIETKVLDTVSSNIDDIVSGGATNVLTNFAQGVEQGEFIGAKIDIKMIRLNLYTELATSLITGDGFNDVRVIIIQAREFTTSNSSATWPLLTDFLPDFGTTVSLNKVAMTSYEAKKQYKILYDRRVHLETNNQMSKTMKIKIPGRKLKGVQFTGASNTHTAQGHVYFYIFSDSTTTPHPLYRWASRVYYKDA